MRANVHGTNSFTIDYSRDGGTTFTTIRSGMTYTITANTPESYNGFSVAFNVPAQECEDCLFRLRGMGPPEWFNCARIKIVAAEAGVGQEQCEAECDNGECNNDGVCKCQAGWGGVRCDTQTAGGAYGAVTLAMELRVQKANFNRDVFITKLAELTGVNVADINLKGPSKSPKGEEYVHVEVTFSPKKSSEVSGVEAATFVTTEVANGNPVGDYMASDVTNISGEGKKKDDTNGEAAAAVVLVLFFVGAIAATVIYVKKHPEKAPALSRFFGGGSSSAA
jgi:hypothetical protein